MSELTSIIMICCFELIFTGKFVPYIWRIFFDNQLSIVLTKLETIHENLIRLNVIGPIRIKLINWITVIGIIVNVMGVIVQIVWIYNLSKYIPLETLYRFRHRIRLTSLDSQFTSSTFRCSPVHCLPNDEINSLRTEEDVEELLKQMQETGLHDSKQNIEEVISPISEQQENMMDTDTNLRKCERCFIFLEADNESTNCMNCQRHEQIQNERHKSSECLKKQAKKMMTISNKKFTPLEVGTTVKVSIPDVDRARGSPRNLLAVITQVEDDLYKLGTENGIIKHLYTRSQIDPCKECFVDLVSVNTEKEITLREAAGFSSVTGSQAGILCNSKCHNSMPCENK
ncbi:unnamed protein product [Macrosiphum euphorbiae]|uniref:Uncharacterized protein n=1 Tax=Macrosiphum euphorbiae TaxID=13131 RepID=A0AAV0VTS3_9HEMI|nr:unnamed protein product [Macrosiphum euphorbiae]